MEAVFAPFFCAAAVMLILAMIFLAASIRIVQENSRLSV